MKRFILMVALICILFVIVCPQAIFAAGSNSSRPPSWTAAQETMASGETWYAFATAKVRQYKTVEVGSQIILTDANGKVFQAEVIEIVPFLAGSDPRIPSRAWIRFKSENQTLSDLAVIFFIWGRF